MQEIPLLKQQYEELAQSIQLLQQMITKERLNDQATASLAHQKLCQLVTAIKTHLAEEDDKIYPLLLTHTNPGVKTLAWNFIGKQKLMLKEFNAFVVKLDNCQFEFDTQLIEDTQKILYSLEQCLHRERNILLPQLELLNIRG